LKIQHVEVKGSLQITAATKELKESLQIIAAT
jgi:hypothetical protein